MNRCDISEEETTKALQEKYLTPGNNGVPVDMSDNKKQEPLKSRSLDDRSLPAAKSNLIKKSNFQNVNRSDNLRGEQIQINGGLLFF